MTYCLIFAHIDADGITSARIAYLTFKDILPCRVIFTRYIHDALTKKDLELIERKNPKVVVVVDIPLSEETYQVLEEVRKRNLAGRIIVIDHHPSEHAEEVDGVGFEGIVTSDGCGAALTYKYLFKEFGDEENSEWALYWAAVGTVGDVADKTPVGKEVLEEFNKTFVDFEMQFWDNNNKRLTTYPMLSMIARYWNTARRVAYHFGAKVAFRACAEVERSKDFLLPLKDVYRTTLEPRYPNLALLQRWQRIYQNTRRKVLSKAQDFLINAPIPLGVAVFRCWMDIGGYIASVKSKYNKKLVGLSGNVQFNTNIPYLAINYGVPGKYAKISARYSPDTTNNIDLSREDNPTKLWFSFTEFFQKVAEVSLNEVGGGGHAVAAAGAVRKKYPLGKLIKNIRDAWLKCLHAEGVEFVVEE